MTKRIRFGIIGTGMIAAMHAEAIAALDHAEAVAVYDKDQKRCHEFAKKYNVEAVDDFNKFLADKSIDAVTIATPSGVHSDVAIPAARAGKHILCEKPLEVTLDKADAIIRECDKCGVILSVVFQSRFSKNVQLIKKAYNEGRFGRVVLTNAQIKWFRSQEYYDSISWRGIWSLAGGGVLMNQAIHSIDLLLYLNGEPAETFAYTGILTHKDIQVEDNACAILKFKNGSLGVIEASTSCAPGFPSRLEISGSNGSIVLEDDQIIRWQFKEEYPEDALIRESNISNTNSISGGAGEPMAGVCYEGHRRQIENMIDVILYQKPLFVSGHEGRRAVQLICGIYESAITGKPVKLC